MYKSFDQSKNEVSKLCQYFGKNRQEFLSPGIKEAHIRQLLIDPLFEALGWDIRNTDQVAPQYREVVTEDSLDVEGHQKAPDYCFRVGTLPKFYAEAKKCGINISSDPGPAYQLRRYGWSAKVPLSILTDFEEMSIYDCTIRPKQKDKAGYARTHYFFFEEYHDRWREIWDVFSREAVWSGAFDRYAASKRKRGTSEVDEEFLKEIESWRDTLARNIALRNEALSTDDLNAAVQRTIDRIVFLRMAEDRGIEPYEQLLKLCEREEIYPRFMKEICNKADQKYNSGLFHFQKEKGISEAPDQITPRLSVDDKAIKPILQNLYFAHGSPYHFGVLPVEILGTVYERFLGKVIRLTAGHRAKIEEKPEVRKAGGVYYTPDYIVNYIVEHTVGAQIEGKSPRQLAGKNPFRILDMACGSGSFLLGAYSCLLNHCLNWYINHNPSRYKKAVYKDNHTGQWHLTILEKKRLLTTHIFGVDIDPQAVEVSKLSLLLKVLEGETDQSIGQQMQLFQERALPNLADNIKCGNSLIGPDYFAGRLIVDEEEMKHVNPLNWERAFPKAINAGGFDCIIGNPPWGADFSDDELAYNRLQNKQIIVRMIDSFMYFTYQALLKLKQSGIFGMILPDVLLYQGDNEKLRRYILENHTITHALNMGDVFQKVTRPACIAIIRNQPPNKNLVTVADFSNMSRLQKSLEIHKEEYYSKVKQREFLGFPSSIIATADSNSYKILSKILSSPHLKLIECVDSDGIQRGVSPDLKEAFIVSSSVAHSAKLEKKALRHTVTGGKHVKRFYVNNPELYVIYTSRDSDFRELPNICRFIDKYKLNITCKEVKQGKHPLYSLHRPRKENIFTKSEKIIGVITEDEPVMAIDPNQLYPTDGLYLFGVDSKINARCLLGILNSRLLVFLYRLIAREKGRVLAQVKPTILETLPIPLINKPNYKESKIQMELETLVNSMTNLCEQLVENHSCQRKSIIERQIEDTDSRIDHIVYSLYNLNQTEINIVDSNIVR